MGERWPAVVPLPGNLILLKHKLAESWEWAVNKTDKYPCDGLFFSLLSCPKHLEWLKHRLTHLYISTTGFLWVYWYEMNLLLSLILRVPERILIMTTLYFSDKKFHYPPPWFHSHMEIHEIIRLIKINNIKQITWGTRDSCNFTAFQNEASIQSNGSLKAGKGGRNLRHLLWVVAAAEREERR